MIVKIERASGGKVFFSIFCIFFFNSIKYLIKYVKKPNGAKPGMVIYTNNKTLYANPQNIQ